MSLSKERQEKIDLLKEELTHYHNLMLECIDKGFCIDHIQIVYNIKLQKLIQERTN